MTSTAGPTITGATVRVSDGANAGRSTTTTAGGGFTLANLTTSGFTLGITAPFYLATAVPVTLTSNQAVTVQLAPTPLFTRAGSGDTVFDMPTIARIRIQGSYPGNSSNFVVYIAGRLMVNELLGRAWGKTTFDGTYLSSGGVTEIRISSGVAWTFTEVR